MLDMLCIIIPIKNQCEIVKKCLISVLRHYKDQEVIVVDDGSTEGNLLEFLEQMKITTRHEWKFLRNNVSEGHTKACEFGINRSKSENIFLLNSDTIVTKNSLNILSKVLDDNKDIAVVGPSTTSASGSQMIKELYDKRFQMTTEEIEKYAENLEKEPMTILNIDLVNGFCMGIKRSVFEEVGRFDPELTAYGNEKELQIRIRNKNFRTVWVKNSFVLHFGKMSYSHENINIGVAQRDADRYIQKKYRKLT